ncbi:MAG TPA: CHAD domain-containing protein [Candidatus Baltobacteraceae bacterium]|nr:CHAD domain-containing protein [Candidatus Baltobacteraceae bacterium]
MADDRIREWAFALEKTELAAFERARLRFLRRPTAKRLHALRAASRKLRSLYDDLRDVLHCKARRRLSALIAITGEPRDAGVLRTLLADTSDAREAPAARILSRALRKRERSGLKRVVDALLRFHVESS